MTRTAPSVPSHCGEPAVKGKVPSWVANPLAGSAPAKPTAISFPFHAAR
jgi:hypothetical protein